MNQLEKLLRENANDEIEDAEEFFGCRVNYSEDVNPDAISGDGNDWLERGTSWIWKVGTLAVVDGNKADWVSLYIGHHRDQRSQPEFIGKLHWSDGENDDVGRCLRRYIQTLETGREHPVFHPD